MATASSLQARQDAVRTAVASCATCTAATVVMLKDLVGWEPESDTPAAAAASATSKASKSAATTARSKPRTTALTSRPKSRAGGAAPPDEGLSTSEREGLAVHVINTGLKALLAVANSASQPSKPSQQRPQSPRRSDSAPLSPVKASSLNRSASTSTSETANAKPPRSAPSPAATCSAMIECMRVGFWCVRKLGDEGKGRLGRDKVEQAMLTFVERLVRLGLGEGTLREIRALKEYILEDAAEAKSGSERKGTRSGRGSVAGTSTGTSTGTGAGIADLLSFRGVSPSPSKINTAATLQLYALHVLMQSKKASHIEESIPFLRDTCATSPVRLFLDVASRDEQAAAAKAATRLQALSKCLLALTPGLSSGDDATALEPRLSPTPTTAFELQALGLQARLHWWRLSGNKDADGEKDVVMPLAGCMRAFIRRTGSGSGGSGATASATYSACASAWRRISDLLDANGLPLDRSSKGGLASILQHLGGAAAAAGLHDEAARWIEDLVPMLDPSTDSMAKQHVVSARLLTSRLRRPDPDSDGGLSSLAKPFLEGLQGPLNGSSPELDDLLGALSSVRAAAIRLLVKPVASASSASSSSVDLPQDTRHVLERLVLYCARFVRRWLGSRPSRDSAPNPRDVVRYEERRRLLANSLPATIDSVLRIIKDRLDGGRIEFDELDETLRDCETVLGDMEDVLSLSPSSSGWTHHGRISTLYGIMFQHLHPPSSSKTAPTSAAFKALRRSVDVVARRSSQEKSQSQLSSRLERYADLCSDVGRTQDAREALQMLCFSLAEDGTLSTVSARLAIMHPVSAWHGEESDNLRRLSRALCALTRLDRDKDRTWSDWTALLLESDRIAVLEHLVHVAGHKRLNLENSPVASLLGIYTVERYPVRRLRTLLQLYAIGAGGQLDINEAVQAQVDMVLGQQIHANNLGEDQGLSSFVPHLRAYYASADALLNADESWPTPAAKEAIATWTGRLVRPKTQPIKGHLHKVVDHPAGLLAHLQSVGDFASMRGEATFLLDVLELSAHVSRLLVDLESDSSDVQSKPSPLDVMIESHTALAARYVDLGFAHKAGDVLERVKLAVQQHNQSQNPTQTRRPRNSSRIAIARFHLGSAEYLLSTGSVDRAEQALVQAKALVTGEGSTALDGMVRAERGSLVALAASLLSRTSLEKGELHQSLSYIKHAVQILISLWRYLESQEGLRDTSMDESSIMPVSITTPIPPPPPKGPQFWSLSYPVLQALAQISNLYAHLGLFKETVYYAEKAQSIANATGSRLYQAQVAAWMGRVWIKAAKLEDAGKAVELARAVLPTQEPTSHLVTLAVELSDVCRELGDEDGENQLLELAEGTAQRMETQRLSKVGEESMPVTADNIVAASAKTTTKRTPATRARVTRAPAKKPVAPTTAKITKPTKTTRSKVNTEAVRELVAAVLEPTSSVAASKTPLLASILIHRALSSMQRRDWSAALDTLHEAKAMPKHASVLSQEQVAAASALISQSMELMDQDPVYGVMAESAISFPSATTAVDTQENAADDAVAVERASGPAPKRGKAAAAVAKAREDARANSVATDPSSPVFLEALQQAQEHLLESHAIAVSNGDGSLVHRISTLLQGTAILLSAAAPATFRSLGYAGYATCSIELARNITWRRESKSLLTETATWSTVSLDWPASLPSSSLSGSRRSSLGFMTDMARFQREFVEVIPRPWCVISMSLSDAHRDLCITKLQADHPPLVIRIPLVKETDDEEGVFGFEEGLAAMRDLIERANSTCHSGAGLDKDKNSDAVKQWWTRRRGLDEELSELLDRIEASWLCGFRGMFSQHRRREDALDHFQRDLTTILDNHLPSRRLNAKRKKKQSSPTVTLDPRILDLFIGLGPPSASSDLTDALEDLLYFVVDVLLFNGERNAYEEVDFEAMLLDTLAALTTYHCSVGKFPDRDVGAHTVLILDKHLNTFPWESLSCMRGLAVSRVPSLACLKRLLVESCPGPSSSSPPGHHASRNKGTYILNPSQDLPNTLATFSGPFSSHLSSWASIISRSPSEAEFEDALSQSDVMLYFGHGSGAQYIRQRTLRALPKCRAVAMLMGCSSGALPVQGSFEPAGTARNYLLSGCPAVVGTLWDVTDRDIDKFAGAVFEEWGLLPEGGSGVTKSEGGKAKGRNGKGKYSAASLVESVAAVRDSDTCRLRFLNGAAVVVYGIPVYLA